jgi:hypothetical protein
MQLLALESSPIRPTTSFSSGGDMKARAIVLTLAVCFFGAAVCFAADAFLGTWKLNEAQSKLSPAAPKNITVVYETAGDDVKVTIDGTDIDGKPTHNEWTGKYDGKDYPVAGDPSSDTRSVKKTNDYTADFMAKEDGKVTITGRIIVSPDGQHRTVTTNGTDPKGNKFSTTAVYDKQ